MTISPCTPAGTGLLLSSTTTTSYPGTGWVGEPGLTALASIPRLRAAMGQPVSVCHQWSMTGTDRTSRAHSYVVGSSRSPARNRARDVLSVPVIDHWWQTETGWPIAALSLGIEAKAVKPGSPTHPVPGYDVVVVDESSNPVPAGVQGEIVIRQPLPPGALTTLYNADERFRDSYFTCHPGFYRTGDGGYFDEDGYIWVMGRIDDVINVAGHRLSTGAMEEILAQHPAVAECAVIGVVNSVKGQVPMGLVVLKAGVEVDPQQLRSELILGVRKNIGAIASFHDVEVVAKLP